MGTISVYLRESLCLCGGCHSGKFTTETLSSTEDPQRKRRKRGVNDKFEFIKSSQHYEQTYTILYVRHASHPGAGILGCSAGPAAEDRLSAGDVTAQLAFVRSCHRS